jgi:hypothetical protein
MAVLMRWLHPSAGWRARVGNSLFADKDSVDAKAQRFAEKMWNCGLYLL